jgi:hypothetical protein
VKGLLVVGGLALCVVGALLLYEMGSGETASPREAERRADAPKARLSATPGRETSSRQRAIATARRKILSRISNNRRRLEARVRSKAERKRRSAKRRAHWLARVQSEQPDSAFEFKTRTKIQSDFAAFLKTKGKAAAGVTLKTVECRGRICRVDIDAPDAIAPFLPRALMAKRVLRPEGCRLRGIGKVGTVQTVIVDCSP